MNKIIIVGGTHGSGKSTLARKFTEQHYGILQKIQVCGNDVLITSDGRCAILGSYDRSCGGIDGYSGWDALQSTIQSLTEMECPVIFAEGVITYGKERYMWMSRIPNYEFMFIKLNTPVLQSVENVKSRRAERGDSKDLDPGNIFRKEKSWYSMYISLLENGVERCYNLPFDEALNKIIQFTGGHNEHCN